MSAARAYAPPRALFDPADLTAAERGWLIRLNAFRHYRWKGGYKAIGDNKLCSLAMYQRLYARGLVRQMNAGNGTPYVEVNGLGMQLVAILAQRAERRGR